MGDIITLVLVRSDLLILLGFGIAIVLLFCLFRDHNADRETETLKDSADHTPVAASAQVLQRPRKQRPSS